MDDLNSLCMSCMTHSLDPDGVCARCGADEKTLWTTPHHLRPRMILNGKYLLGRVIGEGGFGITYVAWDLTLSLKVAIKEYYPNGFVTRDTTSSATVRSFTGEKGEYYERGRQRFLQEAQRLARFFGMPGIVAVKDFFTENGTAYIVMEFVEGATIKTVLANMNGRMPEAHVLEIMKPLIGSLASMHRAGVIHRDIAPDNIMIQPDGSVKLLDFGAASEVTTDGKSTTAIMKHGYAPEEQYDPNRSRQGPWTDVYAICATIFRAIEGQTPPDAISRLRQDTFRGFSIPVGESTRQAVLRGLAVAPENRWRDVDALMGALYATSPIIIGQVPIPMQPGGQVPGRVPGQVIPGQAIPGQVIPMRPPPVKRRSATPLRGPLVAWGIGAVVYFLYVLFLDNVTMEWIGLNWLALTGIVFAGLLLALRGNNRNVSAFAMLMGIGGCIFAAAMLAELYDKFDSGIPGFGIIAFLAAMLITLASKSAKLP